jgi:hypothetical protein
MKSALRILAATMFVTVTSVTTLAQASAEQARLTAMVGMWDVDFTLWPRPGGPSLATKATSTIRPVAGGNFVEETIEGAIMGAPFETKAWTGYNTGTHQYEATRISSTNTARIAETGTFDDKTKQFELKADYPLGGETWHQRTVISQPSADTMIATSYLSFGAVPEWKGVEIKYTRKNK